MPSPTRQAIVTSFLRLIAKRPPDKITVRDIVDDCGVNRNTFYYYFQDIYAVLEEIYADLIRDLPLGSTASALVTFYSRMLDFTAAHPAAARSLALALGYEGLERYLGGALQDVIEQTAKGSGGVASRALGRRMLSHALLGLCLDAMRGGKETPPTPAELLTALPLDQFEKENV